MLLAGSTLAQQPAALPVANPADNISSGAPASTGQPATASAASDSASQSATPAVQQAAVPAAEAVANPASAVSSAALPAAGKTAGAVIVQTASPKDLSDAKRAFDSGVKLKNSGKTDLAFQKFERAAELNPHNVEYVTARELTRQELVMDALNRGNHAMQEQKEVVAMAEFRRALEYDPTNDFANQRLHDSVWTVAKPGQPFRVAEGSDEVLLQPHPGHHDFHFRGDARSLMTELGKAYGITVIFDDSVKSTRTRFDIEDVNFATAAEAATRVTKTFWIALSPKQMLVLADTAENRRSYERMSIRTFYMNDVITPQELAEMVNALRVVLELRFVVQNPTEMTITIRAPQPLMEVATKLLENMAGGRPEVLLDIRVFQISHTFMQQLGTNLPNQFTLFNISPTLLAGLGAGAQNLINQLIASGGINQANSTAIQALLAQLQQSAQSSLSQLQQLQPFATFGGGLTLMGLHGTPSPTINFNLSKGDVRNLENATLRTAQNTTAIMRLGERYPIVNATYAPIYNTAAISSVLSNGSYIAPFPSINYEDLGMNIKATPTIHSDTAVTLKLELQLRSLGAATVNGIPIINNEEYSGTITAREGESSVIAGIISDTYSRNISGWPFLSRVPGLSYGFSEHDKNVNESDLLVVITPHIVRMPSQEAIVIPLESGH